MNSKFENKVEIVEFGSLNEFYKYICDTPFNEAFRWENHSSVTSSARFAKTMSFEEAVDLFKNGWSDMATKLVQKLKASETKTQPTMKPKNTLSVCGYQAIVPLYLNGVPNNMVNKKMVPVKQKVITINKSISYSAFINADTIIDESIKAMRIIKKFEAQGHRCNLNIVLGTKSDKSIIVKIKIKSSDEKMNVSKLAFPLVHPSMLRRLLFRFIEVHPTITKGFVYGYGTPVKANEMRKFKSFDGEYFLPEETKKNVDEIKSVEDLW